MPSDVTERQFRTYVRIQRRGLVNMIDWQQVQKYAHAFGVFLDRRQIEDIRLHYEHYEAKFKGGSDGALDGTAEGGDGTGDSSDRRE